MNGSFRVLGVILLACCGWGVARGDTESPLRATVGASIATHRDHVRQFAFDGDDATHYESVEPAAADDWFVLKFDQPVRVTSLGVATGRPDGSAILKAATLEVADSEGLFRKVAPLKEGQAQDVGQSELGEEPIAAVRIRVSESQDDPLVIREITVESDSPVATFEYPVEFFIDVSEAPEMEKWAQHVAKLCERQYPMINRELASEGFTPAHAITMRITPDYDGVAAASGTRIVGSVDYFRRNPGDTGAMVHETAHVVQAYRSRRNPSWLVEGVADYIRFVKYEPKNIGHFDPSRARYNQSYRTSARFLAYLADTYDAEIVRKLNRVMREGKYREEVFQELTGKSLADLGAEWSEVINAPTEQAASRSRRSEPSTP